MKTYQECIFLFLIFPDFVRFPNYISCNYLLSNQANFSIPQKSLGIYLFLLIISILATFLTLFAIYIKTKRKNAPIQFKQDKLTLNIEVNLQDRPITSTKIVDRENQSLENHVNKQSNLEKILLSTNNSVIIINHDQEIKIVNEITLDILGFTETELIDQPITTIFEAGQKDKIDRLIQAGLFGTVEVNYVTKEKHKIPMNFSSHFIGGNNQQDRKMVCIADKLYSNEKLEQALHQSRQRYNLTTSVINDGIWDWDLETNQIYFSSRWKSMLGYEEIEITNEPQEWLSRVKPSQKQELQNKIAICAQGKISQFEIEYSLIHKDGQYRSMLCRCVAARNNQNKISRLIGSQADITQYKQIEKQLHYDTYYDRLTGLPNRNFFAEELQQRIASPQQEDLFAVLILDLDRFKTINDSLGHFLGDQLLISIAHRLQQCVRSHDVIARLGGDEFVILLKDINNLQIPQQIAYRIQQELNFPFYLNGQEVFTTTSIGIALSSNHPRHQEGLLRDAEIAMYQAKAYGKNRFVIFENGMYLKTLEKLKLENDLRRAIEREELELYYQPIVKLSNRQTIGFEVLLRWQHPERKFISPAEFIPLAEETGLIIPLGWWVLREACRQMRQWQIKYPTVPSLSISVNISGKQISQLDASEQIKRILQEIGLEPRYLKLEITESAIIENIELAIPMLEKLKNLGIHLSMDDFGTGYSSLSYLSRLPIDILKIDRSFIQGMESEPSKLELVKTIINLAANLEMDIIAEGVETTQQQNQLLALDCVYGQGYFFSPPLPQAAVEEQVHKLHSQSLVSLVDAP